MKQYTTYECERCGRKSNNYNEIYKCEASHTNLTVEELKEYNELKKRAEQWGHILYRTNNQANRDKEDEAIRLVLAFEKKHDIKL